jgi:hypothetical protein
VPGVAPKSLIPAIALSAFLVSYPFLQTAVRLDREFRHDAAGADPQVPSLLSDASPTTKVGWVEP